MSDATNNRFYREKPSFLPCPFCGSPAEHGVFPFDSRPNYQVRCALSSNCINAYVNEETEALAAAKWNRRHLPETIPARVIGPNWEEYVFATRAEAGYYTVGVSRATVAAASPPVGAETLQRVYFKRAHLFQEDYIDIPLGDDPKRHVDEALIRRVQVVSQARAALDKQSDFRGLKTGEGPQGDAATEQSSGASTS